MNRRVFIGGVGASIVVGVAGCTGSDDDDDDQGEDDDQGGTVEERPDGDDGETETDDDTADEENLPDQPEIAAEDSGADDGGVIEARWNAAVFDSVRVDPDDDEVYSADDGEQYIIIQAELTNTGEESLAFYPGVIDIDADGEAGSWTVLDDSTRMELDLDGGDSAEDWIAFSIPEDTDTVTISVDAAHFRVEFDHDDGLELEVVPA